MMRKSTRRSEPQAAEPATKRGSQLRQTLIFTGITVTAVILVLLVNGVVLPGLTPGDSDGPFWRTSADASTGPRIEISPAEVDFGEQQIGTKASTTITVKNNGRTPVRIADIVSTCGCAVANQPTEPIPAGDEVEVEVRMSVRGKIGTTTSKQLTIVFADESLRPIKVPVSSTAAEFVKISPSFLRPGLDRHVELTASDGESFRILKCTPDVFDFSATARTQHLLTLSDKRWSSNNSPRSVKIETDHPKLANTVLAIRNGSVSSSMSSEPTQYEPPSLSLLSTTPRRLRLGTVELGKVVRSQILVHTAENTGAITNDATITSRDFGIDIREVRVVRNGIEVVADICPNTDVPADVASTLVLECPLGRAEISITAQVR